MYIFTEEDVGRRDNPKNDGESNSLMPCTLFHFDLSTSSFCFLAFISFQSFIQLICCCFLEPVMCAVRFFCRPAHCQSLLHTRTSLTGKYM